MTSAPRPSAARNAARCRRIRMKDEGGRMKKSDYGILFPTSVVGSMPRPDFVRDLISEKSPISEADYRARMESAVRYIVALQENAGLDIITDGEWWRKSYIGVIAE